MENRSPEIQDDRPSDHRTSYNGIIIGLVLLALLCVGTFGLFFKSTKVIHTTSTTPPLTHSTYLKLSITPDNPSDPIQQQAIACAEILRKKFASSPYKVTVNSSDNFIELEVDSTDPAIIREITDYLALKAQLSVHLVHRQSKNLAITAASGDETIPDYTPLPHTDKQSTTQVLIRTKPELTNIDVKSAWINPRDSSLVNIELNDAGGEKMHNFTSSLTRNIDQIATVLNGAVINYATLAADSLSKHFVISGIDFKEEAEKIIKALQNPLTSKLDIIEQKSF